MFVCARTLKLGDGGFYKTFSKTVSPVVFEKIIVKPNILESKTCIFRFGVHFQIDNKFNVVKLTINKSNFVKTKL